MLRTPLLRLLAGLVLTFAAMPALMAAGDAKRFKLVIDAGHGGHDAGAVGKSVKEKALNLSVALAFGRLVEANCPDVDVIVAEELPLQGLGAAMMDRLTRASAKRGEVLS